MLLLIWFLSELTAVSKSHYSSLQTNSCFSRFIVFSHHSVFYRKELRPPGLHLNKCPPLHTGLLNDTRFSHHRQLIWSEIRWFNLNEHCCALHVLLFLATFMPPKFIWPLFKYSLYFCHHETRGYINIWRTFFLFAMINRMFTKAIWVNQIFIHTVLESTYWMIRMCHMQPSC